MMRRVLRLVLLGAGAIATITIVVASLDRDAYFSYNEQDREAWQHPTQEVVLVAGAAIAESVALLAVFQGVRPKRVWQRGAVALGPLVLVALWMSDFVIHEPV